MTPRLRIPVLLLAGLLLPLAGCQLVPILVDAFQPPKKIPAVYEPPEGKRVLVFVEDVTHGNVDETVKRELAIKLTKHLVENDVAASAVSYDKLVDFMVATPSYNELGAGNIGQKLGAQLVFFVKIERFRLKEDEATSLWNGEMVTAVSVLDVQERKRLWPEEQRDHRVRPVRLEPHQESSSSYASEVTDQLTDEMSDRIAKLFYEHTIKEGVIEQAEREQDDENLWGGF